ncbi:MAG: prepilin peptidase [Lachnospiraceae bacterium]|nr:prepilin peptidase [Lachnospiraceae bacterium]
MLFLYGILAAALFMDFYRCRIPNGLILAGYLTGFAYCLYTGALWHISLLDSLFIFILLCPLYMIGAFGGGDVKLFMVMAVFLGLENTVNIMITSIMAGAVCSVFKIIFMFFQKKKQSLSHLYIHFSLPIVIGTILVQHGGIIWITF